MPLAALEAALDPESDAAVRACWSALAEAGLPSQAQHPGATNAPHVTLVSASAIGSAHLTVAATILGPILPVELAVSGWAVFGDGSRYTLALLCAAPAAMVSAVEVIARAAADPRAGAWVPHVTVARRVAADELERAIGAVDGAELRPDVVRLGALRHWDPVARTVRPVV